MNLFRHILNQAYVRTIQFYFSFGKNTKQIKYKNMKFFFPRGAIESYKYISGNYGKTTSDQITEYINKHKISNILDIGANLGLITMNIISSTNNVHITAFEAAPTTLKYLKKNIQYNKLNDKVTLEPYALGEIDGKITFQEQTKENLGGSGIKNITKQKAKQVQVDCLRLDTWWNKNKKPKVDLIKIDTEGADYLILKNGKNMILKERPIIFFELVKVHLKKYNITESEIFEFFNQLSYQIKTEKGFILKNETDFSKIEETNFIAEKK